jgi:hypothetical protein
MSHLSQVPIEKAKAVNFQFTMSLFPHSKSLRETFNQKSESLLSHVPNKESVKNSCRKRRIVSNKQQAKKLRSHVSQLSQTTNQEKLVSQMSHVPTSEKTLIANVATHSNHQPLFCAISQTSNSRSPQTEPQALQNNEALMLASNVDTPLTGRIQLKRSPMIRGIHFGGFR